MHLESRMQTFLRCVAVVLRSIPTWCISISTNKIAQGSNASGRLTQNCVTASVLVVTGNILLKTLANKQDKCCVNSFLTIRFPLSW
jgi:hypothetical protein